MEGPLPEDFDPNLLGVPPSYRRSDRIRGQRKRSEERRDDDPPDEGSFEHHEHIPVITDARFTSFLNWVFGIAATLVTLTIVWIANVSVSTAAKVDVLMDRPPSVPVQQYMSDMQQLKDKITSTEGKVTAIEQRQLDGIQRSQ